jgi:hypothetical protein
MMASGGEAVTLDPETICHDRKPAEMENPSEGNNLAMMTAHTVAATKISIAPLATMMTKGKAPAATTTIHQEQGEAVVAAEINRRTARVKDDVTLRHPHQAAPMVVAVVAVVVADQQSHTTLARIRRTRSPMMRIPT